MARSASSSSDTGREDNSGVRRQDEERAEPNDANSQPQSKPETSKDDRKISKISTLWAKLGLDWGTTLMMMKAGLPPTIALAMYQSDDVAETYLTLGYLVAIVSILGFCIMPRAKFIQTMIANLVATGMGAGVCMLMVWSGVQARLHTTPAGAPPQRYNSSQSAVCGVWLFFQVWIVNTMKAKFPQFAFPAVLYSIFVNVAAGFGPTFTTTVQARAFMERLIESFLTGFAITTIVSFFVLPLTSRKVVTKQMAAYITALRGTLQAHQTYLHSLETHDVFSQWRTRTRDGNIDTKKPEKKGEIKALKKLTGAVKQLHSKLNVDLPFAKREIAYGKLTPDDLETLFKHLREIMMPLVGLESVVDLFDRAAERMHWDPESKDLDPESESWHEDALDDWHDIMKSVHDPISTIIQAMDGGLEHAMLRLRFAKLPKKKKLEMGADEEAKGGLVRPGDPAYADYLERQSDIFCDGKETTLRQWVESKGVRVKPDFFKNAAADPLSGMEALQKEPTYIHERNQRQLYLLLYIVFLLHSTSRAILRLVRFADSKDLATAKSKLVYPGKRRFKKWIANTFRAPEANHDDDDATLSGFDTGDTVVHMGAAYNRRKDPEHLPPENSWEKFGNSLRAISRFLRSSESSFGFRVACATMTIAIVNFLRDTQTFFVQQRLIWALIMISLSMTPTAGQSVWAFVLRALGTVVATVVALIIWYIPGKNTAGIIVFLWVFISLGFYIPLKRPDILIAGLIGTITTALIVGYELEVRKLGVEVAESNGQPAYPIYLLGPYRLATVVGGLAVAFIWTFFPFPISEHSAVRQKLGAALYLSANYYSVSHETVMSRVRGDAGEPTDPTSPAYKLAKARNKVFSQQQRLLQGLRNHSAFVRWEFPLGGKFPNKEYEYITQLVTNIVNYTALLAYSSETFTHAHFSEDADPSQIQWFRDFRRVLASANITSHEITSILALLSSSITNGQPLPPYLRAPPAYRLSKRLEIIDREILSVRHIAEPGYAAFAVWQISTSCINMDLEKLLRAVKRLVGELDFSFHVVSTRSTSEATSMDTRYTRKQD